MPTDARYTNSRFFNDRDGRLAIRLRTGEFAPFSRDWAHLLASGESLSGSDWAGDGIVITAKGQQDTIATVHLNAADFELAEGQAFAVVVNSVTINPSGRTDSWTLRVYPPESP